MASMASPITQQRPLTATQIIDEINPQVIGPSYTEANTRAMRGEALLPNTQILRMINGLEIEGFIPVKMAILLKLNWRDVGTSSALLANFVAELRGKGSISAMLAGFILDKIDGGENTDALHLLYACMRCQDGGVVFNLDQFPTVTHEKLMQMIQTRELVHSQDYLKQKIESIHQKFPDVNENCALLIGYIEQNNQPAFKLEYMKLLDAIAGRLPEGVEKIAFEELKETVETIPAPEFFPSLYRILKTHEFYGKELIKVVDLTRSIEGMELGPRRALIARCTEAFQNTLHFLADFKNMPCGSKTLYCLHHGLIRGEWLKINALFQREKHSLCDCHAVDNPRVEVPGESTRTGGRDAFWPLHQKPFILAKHDAAVAVADTAETVAVFGCAWGSGHKQTTLSVAEILNDRGMHPVSVDIPGDLLADQDAAKKATGSWLSFTTQDIFNCLLQNKAFALINFLRWATGMNNTKEPSKQEVRKTLQRLLLINPSQAVTTIGAVSEPIIKAASLMGIPCTHVVTDVDRSVLVRDQPVDYEHYKVALPYNEDVMSPRVSPTERPEQIAIVGPPTKKVYDQDRSPSDIAALRIELGIPRDKKLIVVSSGSNGSFSPYPALLVKRYKDTPAAQIPFVVVVLCGDNVDIFNHATQVAARLPRGTITPSRTVLPETMEKLYRVASYGGAVIGKAGGLTVFELSKCGTRLIIDNMPSKISFAKRLVDNLVTFFNWIVRVIFRYEDALPWEKINQDFAITQGFAKPVSSEDEFFATFDEFLGETEPVRLETPVGKFSEELPRMLDGMKRAVEADRSLDQKRIYRRDPKLAATIF
ncbi:MAG: hypothetical protein NTX49_10500 [Chlamydiae bacterium]|nr:hypothetical protein [Chlamydiota bacterium]